MTISLYPLKWTQALNPGDEVDYTFDLAGRLLEGDETVQSYTLTPSATSVAAGLLTGSGEYATALNGTVLTIWFSIDPAHENDSAFDETGIWLDMALEVTTTNAPPRVRERTLLLRVCRQ